MINLGCSFALLSLGKYLENSHGWNLIFTTLSLSFKMILMIFISTLPIYFGLMLLAKSIFWNSYYFSTLSLTSMTLFSLLQMDSTLDIFKVLVEENLVLGIFYMIFFWIVLFAVSRRIFIVLIEDIYIIIQLKNKRSFVLDLVPFETSHIDQSMVGFRDTLDKPNYVDKRKVLNEEIKSGLSEKKLNDLVNKLSENFDIYIKQQHKNEISEAYENYNKKEDYRKESIKLNVDELKELIENTENKIEEIISDK